MVRPRGRHNWLKFIPDYQPFNEAAGRVMRRARLKRGLTQALVADLAGIESNHYAKIERGVDGPLLHTAYRICQILKIKVSDLLPENEYREQPKRTFGSMRIIRKGKTLSRKASKLAA